MKTLLVFTVTAAFLITGSVPPASADSPVSKVIRTAPPAPKFTDTERHAELARRRAEVAKKMAPNSILILWSAQPRNYAGDVDFIYRQENNHYYLTNLRQPGSMLVIARSGDVVKEYLFLPKRNPQREAWEGKMYSTDDARRISGMDTIIDASEQTAFLTALGKKESFTSASGVAVGSAETVYLLLPNGPRDSEGIAEFNREQDFAGKLAEHKVENARGIFDELRLVKSPYELRILQHSIDITTEALMRSMAVAGKANWEYEVHAEVDYTFRRRNADYWGYPSIVGCGTNATTLHYVESQSPVKPGQLLLMDVGAEYDHYTADVTRTFPVNGKFTREQAEIYKIVFDAQEAVAKATKPGVRFGELSGIANKVLSEGLAKLGLVTAPDATIQIAMPGGRIVEAPQYRLLALHGLGHWLGMNVHDVGDYTAPLRAGMVFTNEPGIYIREDALDHIPDTPANRAFLEKVRPVYEKYKTIGVRIEDDMLVTETGVEWMTKALPRKIEDVEKFIGQASKEFQHSMFIPARPASLLFDPRT